MSRPRPQTRSPKPRKGGPHGRAPLMHLPTIPRPARLAGLGSLVAVAVAVLVMLVSVSAGGLNRFGLQRLAADPPAGASARTGYINR